MSIELNEKAAAIVRELATAQGMIEDEVVAKIIEWYAQDCKSEN